jgi:hypothetical protein
MKFNLDSRPMVATMHGRQRRSGRLSPLLCVKG